MPQDAEAWLAERGIRREAIRVAPGSPESAGPDAPAAADTAGADAPAAADTAGADAPAAADTAEADAPAAADTAGADAPAAADTAEAAGAAGADAAGAGGLGDPTVGVREAGRLAAQAAADAELREADAAALPDPSVRRLEDDVAEAMGFVRRSTSTTPQPEARVRAKLAERGWDPPVIDAAIDRARRERLIDDEAMAAALVDERRRKGHAAARIRRDLRARGFDDATLDRALADAETEDPEAAAFAVARDRAQQLTSVTAETAFRRVAGHVARRGYPEGLARKVAREAVFDARDPERTAGH